jgi:hypothetical protein
MEIKKLRISKTLGKRPLGRSTCRDGVTLQRIVERYSVRMCTGFSSHKQWLLTSLFEYDNGYWGSIKVGTCLD